MVRRSKSKPGSESPGQRVARFRRLRGLTQAEIARRLNVTQPVISQYEHDDARPSWDGLIELAELLRVSADQLLGLKSTKSNGVQPPARWGRRLELISKLRPKDQLAIARIIDGFLASRSSLTGARPAHARG